MISLSRGDTMLSRAERNVKFKCRWHNVKSHAT